MPEGDTGEPFLLPPEEAEEVEPCEDDESDTDLCLN